MLPFFSLFVAFFLQGRQSDAISLIKGGQAVMGRPLVLKGLEIRPPNIALSTVDNTAGGSQSAAQQRILEEEGGVAAISLLLELSGCNILGFRDRRNVEYEKENLPQTLHFRQESESTGDEELRTSGLSYYDTSRTDAVNINQEDEEEEHIKDLQDWMEEVALSGEEILGNSSESSIEDVTEGDMLKWNNNSEIEDQNEERLKERKSSASIPVIFQSESQAPAADDALPLWETPFLGLEFGSEYPISFPRKDLVLKYGNLRKEVNDVLLPCQFLGAWIASHPQETNMPRVLPEYEFVFAALDMLRGVGGQIFCFKDTTISEGKNVYLTPEAQGWAVSHLTPACLQNLLEQLAKVGMKFQQVRHFCEEVFNCTNESWCNASVYEVKHGRVVCAFSAGLETLLGQLDDWLGLLATNLYKQRRGIIESTISPADHSRGAVELKNDPRSLTLLRLLNVLTPWHTCISIVLDVMRRGVGWRTTDPGSLQQPAIRLTATHLLNVLYEESEFNGMHPPAACEGGSSTTEYPVEEEERWKLASPPEGWLLGLFCTSAAPYLRLLDEWVLSGMADDLHGELFFETVSTNVANSNSQGGEVVHRQDQIELSKLSKGREIVPYTNITMYKDCIPWFLTSTAKIIVLSGYSTSLLSRIRLICGRSCQSNEYKSSQMVKIEPFLENGLMELSHHVLVRRMHTDKPALRHAAAATANETTSCDQQQPLGISKIAFQSQPGAVVHQNTAASRKKDETITLPFPPLPTTATLNSHTVNPFLLQQFTSITGVIMPCCPHHDKHASSKAEVGNEELQVVPPLLTDFQSGCSKPLRKALESYLLYKLSIAMDHVGKACCDAMLKDLGMLSVLRCMRGVFLLGEPQLMETYICGLFSAFGRLTFVNGWKREGETGEERFGACGHPDPLSFLKDSTHMTWLLHRSFSAAADEHQEWMASMGSCISILEKPLVGGVIPLSKLFSVETAFPGCSPSSPLVTIRSISLIGLTCHLPWPYKIVTSPSTMKKYNKVHCLLIQVSYVKNAITYLQGKWQAEWRSGSDVNRTTAIQLFVMSYLVRSVHSHFLIQAVASKWNNNLEVELLEASSLSGVIAAHDTYLNNLTYRCLLRRQHKPALNYLLDILQSCMSFVEYNFRGGQMVRGGGKQMVDDHCLNVSQQAYESFIRNCCFLVALLEQVIVVIYVYGCAASLPIVIIILNPSFTYSFQFSCDATNTYNVAESLLACLCGNDFYRRMLKRTTKKYKHNTEEGED